MIIQTRSYHLLADIAFSLHHNLTAVTLCLAVLRELQTIKERTGLNLHTWLDAKTRLVQCLARVKWPQDLPRLDWSLICSEAINECEACGDVELHSQLLYISATYHYSQQPPTLIEVIRLSQACLDQLNTSSHVSQAGKLLKAQATLLLTEVLSLEQVSTEIIKIYQGLVNLLEDQVSRYLI